MKKRIYIAIILILAMIYSCSDEFLDTTPLGVTSENVFNTQKGVEALITGAYAVLDGSFNWVGWFPPWTSSQSNWVWGSIASDDAYKGSSVGDQPLLNQIERYEILPDNRYMQEHWRAYYEGVSRTNRALISLSEIKAGGISQEKADELKGEALFLRAWFHFELKRVYNNIPYITEDVEDPAKVPNTVDAWPMLESDLQFAVDHLPEHQSDVGRATKYAAEAVLARVKLFQQKYSEAKPLLDDILDNGGFELVDHYFDNYKIATRNNKESIFEIQFTTDDGARASINGNFGDLLCHPSGGDVGSCCGFFQPSQNFVNAFKVDPSGLPLLDTFNDTNLANDMGIPSADNFVPSSHLVDPRLDWTVGRRGIPFLDYGVMRGMDQIRAQSNGGPYVFAKNMYYKSEQNTPVAPGGGAMNTNNYRAYRLAHVMLWRAEVAVEENDLATALDLVNQIRERASHEVVMGRCSTYELPAGVDPVVDWNQPAANYLVSQYSSFPDQDYARKAVRMEERLEYGMEGHRFFDLVRWGVADVVLNAYIERDVQFRTFLTGAHFEKGVDEYRPIPQLQIDIQGTDILQQNPGY